MKIEQIIVWQLFINKQVTLQGIGTFRLDPSVYVPANSNHTITIPETAVTFEYNANAIEDIMLINAIMHHTKKLKPLAAADLDSFLHWQKQLLNINMAFKLENIGVLNRTLQGELRFIPCPSQGLKNNTSSIRETKKSAGSIFDKFNLKGINYSKNLLPVTLLIIFGLGISTWAIYLFFGNNNMPGKKLFEQKKATSGVGNKFLPISKDIPDPVEPRQALNKKSEISNYVFKVVFLKTKVKKQALKTFDEIYGFGHSPVMYLTDSLYKVAMPFNRPISDTSQIKDSLNRYNSLVNGAVEVE